MPKTKAQAIEHLRWYVTAPGARIYTVLRHVSASGGTRWISPILVENDRAIDISYLVGPVLGARVHQSYGGVKMEGGGMDLGFELVYQLGLHLFPKGFAVEGRGRNGDMSGWDTDGGYALKQEWL